MDRDLSIGDAFKNIAERFKELGVAITEYGILVRNLSGEFLLTSDRLEDTMIDMRLPMDDEGNWLLDYDKAKEFWQNLDNIELDIKDDEVAESQELDRFLSGFKVTKKQEVVRNR